MAADVRNRLTRVVMILISSNKLREWWRRLSDTETCPKMRKEKTS